MKLRIAICCLSPEETALWRDALHTEFERVGQSCHTTLWPDADAQADYALIWGADQAFVDAHARVKALFRLGAGVDAVLKLHLPPGLPILRVEDGGMAAQMAEYVVHSLLRHVRQFDVYEHAMREGLWQPMPAPRKSDFPVGVMGLGALGAHVAQTLLAWGFPVNGWSRSAKALPGVRTFAGDAALVDFLRASRVLVCLLPLTPQTRDVINAERLRMLQRPGYLINVARGAHVVDADLLACIESGQIAGAALDVFREEPLPADHPFRRDPRIMLTPHTAAETLVDASVAQIVQKILALERGEPVTGVVDRARAY